LQVLPLDLIAKSFTISGLAKRLQERIIKKEVHVMNPCMLYLLMMGIANSKSSKIRRQQTTLNLKDNGVCKA
jgi:hypothetical protein